MSFCNCIREAKLVEKFLFRQNALIGHDRSKLEKEKWASYKLGLLVNKVKVLVSYDEGVFNLFNSFIWCCKFNEWQIFNGANNLPTTVIAVPLKRLRIEFISG